MRVLWHDQLCHFAANKQAHKTIQHQAAATHTRRSISSCSTLIHTCSLHNLPRCISLNDCQTPTSRVQRRMGGSTRPPKVSQTKMLHPCKLLFIQFSMVGSTDFVRLLTHVQYVSLSCTPVCILVVRLRCVAIGRTELCLHPVVSGALQCTLIPRNATGP